MSVEQLKEIVQKVVAQAAELKDKHTAEANALVNYACIFSQSEEEFKEISLLARRTGKVIEETPTGPLFQIAPLQTSAGPLQLLKVRQPDASRPEQGDADFTVRDYQAFKKTNLAKHGFKLIKKENFEMIELIDSAFKVRAYFSHPPLDQQLGLVKK